MPQRLAGKPTLITGGGNGIGREIAQRFAAEGARIASIDTDDAGNSQTTSLIQASGGWCEPVRGDVSKAADVERAFRVAGTVHILVNMPPSGPVTVCSVKSPKRTGTVVSSPFASRLYFFACGRRFPE